MSYNWSHIQTLSSCQYTCGYCGLSLASEKGWDNSVKYEQIRICHNCNKPTYFFDDATGRHQTPGIIFGDDVEHINDEKVKHLYQEARKCTSNNSFTAAVLCCRKLLMHIAVAKGAKENLKFIEYVDYLADNKHITEDAKDWVDHIRQKGNEATHEVVIMNQEDAEDLICFSGMLLRLIYEFPAKLKKDNK